MTEEERTTRLIRHLKYNRSIGADYLITDKDVDIIIKALEQQPSDDCVSRAEVNKLYDEYRPRLATHVSEFGDKLKALPPVTPTHGTCKDCHNAVKNYGNGRIYCLFSNCIYDEDFWCKKFEKRGDENGI